MEQHTSPTFGHGGTTKLWEVLLDTYYFPHMVTRIKEWIKECHECKKAKASRHKPYGELKPIEPPERGGEVITMDFIVKLPKSKEPATGVEYDSIDVTVDKLTKFARFIPVKETWTASDIAYITLRHQVANQDLPRQYITDRDKIFASKFWQTLMECLGTKHRLSTAYHPQTDGQTERVNQVLETYLRMFVNEQQSNWVELLPVAQLAYNGTYQETIGMSPFKATFGYDMTVARTPLQAKHQAEAAILGAQKLMALHKQLSLDIKFLNERMAYYANKRRSQEPSFKKGDKVYLIRKNLKTKRKSDKLDWKKFGAYEVLEKVSDVNYKIRLPKKSRLHPIFHVSLLELAAKNAPLEKLDVENEHGTDIYEVEKILDSRISTETGEIEYLIKWKNWDNIHNTWEPIGNLRCPQKLKEFHRQNPTAVGAQ
jgi:transposase InsO family protein